MQKFLLVLMGIILVLSASAKFYEPVQNREIEMGNYTGSSLFHVGKLNSSFPILR